MIDKDAHALDPPLKRLGAPVFDLAELLELMEHKIGGGIFNTVYSIKDHPSFAVKKILLDSLDQRSIDAAKLELTTLTTLTHPGILRYHQVLENENGDLIYIVMDRHDTSLEALITKHRQKKEPIPAEKIVALAGQVAGALAYLHGFCGTDVNGRPYRGIVHRDLKPDNVLVSEDGSRVVLADFGLCKDALRSGTTLAGTKPYMAPETLLYNSTSPASDIWALGVIIYELATLKRLNFLGNKEPKDVFIDGWKSNLNAIEDDFIRGILEMIFVLDQKKRSTAKELAELFQESDILTRGLEIQVKRLEVSLDNANVRITTLKREHSTMSAEIDTLKKELTTKSTTIDTLEAQCKDQLTVTKTLEDKIAQLTDLISADNSQSEFLLLPQLIRAAHVNSTETVRVLVKSGDGIGKRDEQGRTALMHAAQQGHVEPARLLVEKEKGLQDRSGWTALMHAVHNNHPRVVEILAAHECGKRDNSRRTALMIAAGKGYTEIAAALAPHEKGLTDDSGNTALMLAASNAHTEAVRVLAEHERGARDTRSRTALMTAGQRGDLEMVKVLAEHEKGIKDEDGHTALVHAARAGHREAAELLMEHEKDVLGWTMLMCAAALGDVDMVSQHLSKKGQKDKQGRTALIIAAQRRHDEVVRLLMEHEGSISGWTSLICAAYLGDVDVVRNNLHEKGQRDDIGMTALMWAAKRRHTEVVRLLAEHEGGMQDWSGYTALMGAAQHGHKEVVEIFLEHEKGIKDTEGNTAFTHALKNRHTDIALLLRECEAPSWTPLMCAAFTGDIELAKRHLSDKDKKNNKGETALMIAARMGHEDIVELLDPTDWRGVTALMRAAARGNVDAVRALTPLQKGRKANNVKINGRDTSDGGTALMLAAARGYAEVVKLLVEYEGGIKDEDGWTALMYAAENGYKECVRLLVERERNMETTREWDIFPPGTTALDIAKEREYRGIISILSK